MPLIVDNDLLFIWGSVGSVSNQFLQCWHVGRGDFLDGWGEGIGVVWGAVFVPFVDGLEGVQL